MYGHKRANDGYRARVGMVLPSVNTVMDAWFPRAAPEGVTFHAARVPMPPVGDPMDILEKMAVHELAAARMLIDCDADIIMYVCTAASLMRGRAYDLQLMAEISRETGIPCCTVTHAILRAFEHLGVRRISAISPYPKHIDEREVAFFTECGLDLLNMEGFGIENGSEMADPSPGEIYRFGKAAVKPGSEALLISCGAMRAHYVAEQLERDLGIPVISSTTATFWAALRFGGVMDAVPGYGRLLGEVGSPDHFRRIA